MKHEQTLPLQHLAGFLREFKNRKIVVVGDVIADQFLSGAISRVSREAPVFILRHEQTETVPGGAANAAMNVAALGAQSVLLGVIGDDAAGAALQAKLSAANVETGFLQRKSDWQTITKTRIFAGQAHAPRQQVIRIDYENQKALDAEIQNEIAENLRAAGREADAVIVSDYNYGVANAAVLDVLNQIAKRAPVLVDSRYRLSHFSGAATSATPNEAEIEEIAGKAFSDLSELETFCQNLCARLNFRSLLVTRGKDGMILFETERAPIHFAAAGSLDAVDVTGAGDTVMATFALAVASGASFIEAAQLANRAGGIVVMKRGTATVSAGELLDSLGENSK
jgi:D-glycero-beta-D-manno-heptose-7-phosphate kinase